MSGPAIEGAGEGGRPGGGEPGVADIYPLTPLQGGVLYHALAEPGSGVYVVQYTCEIVGRLDKGRFREAWSRAFERHPPLRTAFVWEGLDEPLQAVRELPDLPWEESDWSGLSDSERADRLDHLLRDDRARGFALDLAPLTRLRLIRTGKASWRFLWTFHHIILDGWSAVTLLERVFRETADLDPPATADRPFREFVAWLRRQEPEGSRAYWEDRLNGIDGPTVLPTAIRALRDKGHAVRRRHLRLDESETGGLRELARRHRLTLATLLHGAWALVLSRYAREPDVLYGAAVSGRPASLPGAESMIGLFINSLPVRIRVEAETELIPWLRAIQDDLFDMRAHEQTALASIAEWTGIGASRAPFESLLVYESSPLADRSPADGTGLELRDVRYLDQSNYPLALLVFPGPELELTAVYREDRLDGELAERLLGSVARALRGFTARPGDALGELPPPDGDECERLLFRGAGGEARLDDRDVLHRFRDHVVSAAEAPAIMAGGETWTYAQLAARVDSKAEELRRLGVVARTRVALVAERSPAAISGMLAVLRSGGAYVPVSGREPSGRIRLLLEDAGAELLLAEDDRAADEAPPGVRVVGLGPADSGGGGNFADTAARSDLAYVLYTSGSTGRPKGVCVSRANLAYSIAARDCVYDRPPAAFLLLSPLTFDSSVVGVYWTLATGGRLVLPEPGREREPAALAELIREHRVTHTLCIPALWSLVLDQADPSDLASLECAIVAGEVCPPGLARRHHEVLPGTGLYNEYGPTEATVWATVHRVPRSFTDAAVPIGRPIPGTRIYLTDAAGRLSPDGAVGEICIAGPGVAPGYLDRDDLTAERFVDDPFAASHATDRSRTYRTGDLGRWSSAGDLVFLGRTDDQIKVRGQRIEPAEIEAALTRRPGVREAVVVGRSRETSGTLSGRRRGRPVAGPAGAEPALGGAELLVAYVVGESPGEPSIGDLLESMEKDLPDFMVPARIVRLEEIPRTRNGKVDRSRLPPADLDGEPHVEPAAPRTPTERALIPIWEEVLGLDRVGIHDHFFEIGGHSLLAIRLLGAIRETLSVDLPFDDFFGAPTIAASAARIADLMEERNAPRAEGPAEPGFEEFEI